LNYWLNAVDEHSIQSPYFFELYTNVIKNSKPNVGFDKIEAIRAKLVQDQSQITVCDLGAPSQYFKSDKRTIATVAASSLAPAKMALLLFRLASHIKAKQIVELGTSLGVSTLYLSKCKNATIHTFEGNMSLINIALTNFESTETNNVVLVEGNIDETLPEFVEANRKLDFVLMDANHRYEPTIKYFNLLVERMTSDAIVVVDDIYQSKEMAKAWKEIRGHKLVYGSMDLFRFGLLFFDSSLNKQHYTCAW
jgi:predicted O-methyltransferase YrrM